MTLPLAVSRPLIAQLLLPGEFSWTPVFSLGQAIGERAVLRQQLRPHRAGAQAGEAARDRRRR